VQLGDARRVGQHTLEANDPEHRSIYGYMANPALLNIGSARSCYRDAHALRFIMVMVDEPAIVGVFPHR
jgi:hypothetical protein